MAGRNTRCGARLRKSERRTAANTDGGDTAARSRRCCCRPDQHLHLLILSASADYCCAPDLMGSGFLHPTTRRRAEPSLIGNAEPAPARCRGPDGGCDGQMLCRRGRSPCCRGDPGAQWGPGGRFGECAVEICAGGEPRDCGSIALRQGQARRDHRFLVLVGKDHGAAALIGMVCDASLRT